MHQTKINSLIKVNEEFWTQNNSAPSKLHIHSKDFFKILHIERGHEAHASHINYFSKKVSFGANGPF